MIRGKKLAPNPEKIAKQETEEASRALQDGKLKKSKKDTKASKPQANNEKKNSPSPKKTGDLKKMLASSSTSTSLKNKQAVSPKVEKSPSPREPPNQSKSEVKKQNANDNASSAGSSKSSTPTKRKSDESSGVAGDAKKIKSEKDSNGSPAAKKKFNPYAYAERGPPPKQGQKEIPEGKPYCLAGLTFVMTGVLDSLDKEEFKDLVCKYGGRVTSAVSSKTSYLVKGTDAGGTKTKAAEEKNVQIIDEDGLLELVRTLPANTPTGGAPLSKAQTEKAAQKLAASIPAPTPPKSSSSSSSSSGKKVIAERYYVGVGRGPFAHSYWYAPSRGLSRAYTQTS